MNVASISGFGCLLRPMRRFVPVVLAGLTAALLAHPATARAEGEILDQSQLQTDGTWAPIGDHLTGQIFTSGMHGFLLRVSVYLEADSTDPPTVPIRVMIQAISGGAPSGTSIGFGEIAPESIPASAGWVDIGLDGALLARDTQYVIILFAPAGKARWYHYMRQDLYDGGREVVNYDRAWQFTFGDAMFRTYVIPDRLDQAQAQSAAYQVVTGMNPAGQTLLAGLYGMLNRVSLKLENDAQSPATGSIVVSVQEVRRDLISREDVPSGREIGRGIIPAGDLPAYGSGGGWVNVDISPVLDMPLAIPSGTKYALLVMPSDGAVNWYTSSGDAYAEGTLLIRSGTRWTAGSGDTCFETYILLPILDQATSPGPGYNTFYGGRGYTGAQVFTAGLTGYLDQVVLYIANDDPGFYPTSGPITVGIQLAPQGYPSGSDLGTATIPFDRIPVYFGWTGASFAGVPVRKGSQYAIAIAPYDGRIKWSVASPYSGGILWSRIDAWAPVFPERDGEFKTYVLPFKQSTQVFWGVAPCIDGVCPEVSGRFTPADLTEGVTGQFNFQVRPDGTAKGVLNFADTRPDGMVLHGCTTDSRSCRLNITTMGCSRGQEMTVGGSYTPRGGEPVSFGLKLSGQKTGPGMFSLKSGEYRYDLTRPGIVDVTCPVSSP